MFFIVRKCAHTHTRNVPSRLMLSKPTSAYPSFMKMLTKWLQDLRPAVMEQPFPFTSISLNFNYNAKLHRDGNNTGPSMTRSIVHVRPVPA